jgi:osmoprotectant transport system permease protein
MISIIYILVFWGIILNAGFTQENEIVVIGSKKFTESIILGELVKFAFENKGIKASHKKELGGTRILWNALLNGDIDIYPEYTGTITYEIFAGKINNSWQDIREKLSEYNIGISKPLGFNNSYALGMKNIISEKLNIHTISDLKNHPELRLGFSNEVMDREDGWKYWKKIYSLPQKNVIGLDHDLAYRGLNNEDIHVTDLYSTDAEIQYYNLKVLRDDLKIFPQYNAVYLFSKSLVNSNSAVLNALTKLESAISEKEMISLNEQVKVKRNSESSVANSFLINKINLQLVSTPNTLLVRFLDRTTEHLTLFGISMLAAILLSIPLGLIAVKFIKLGQVILGIAGILQTIPSLALLVFMIPLLGIGGPPAILALFLYSILPIVRNTYEGINSIPREITESADALGLSPFAKLRLIEIPMSLKFIISGIKISAVINIGTATLGALIGAGGYGQPILTGIRLDDISLILEGAVPAALLAILIQYIFEVIEKMIVSQGMQ